LDETLAANFENHLFISYAHIDNVPLTPEQQGWVTRLHAALEAVLSMRLGRKAKIWRDTKLSGTDVFADTIVAQFPKTAFLVSIISPRYVESEWCTREVAEFCKAAELSGGVIVDSTLRLIKIIKTPVESDGPLPPVTKKALSYSFYILDEHETPLELDVAFGEKIGQQYNVEVAKVAWHIAQAIKKLALKGPSENLAVPSSKPAVYLAECTYDCRETRDALETELRLHGYPVLPEGQLPRDESEYVAEVAASLEKCKLSIHLVGKNYGAVPDGPNQKSVSILQNDLAIRRSKTGGLSRVIWLSQGTTSQQVSQQQFIDALLKDPETQFGADLVSADVETLKSTIFLTLERLSKTANANPDSAKDQGSQEKTVYLICDERDRKATIPLRKYLRECGFSVQIPLFEGDAASVRETNLTSLGQCDAAIIFYGVGDEYWKRTVDADLKKSRAFREKKRPAVGYTYLADPKSDAKTDLIALEEPNVIQGFGDFTEACLKPLIDELNALTI